MRQTPRPPPDPRSFLPRPTWRRPASPPRYLGCASRSRPVSALTLSRQAAGAAVMERPSRAAAAGSDRDPEPAAAIASPGAVQPRPTEMAVARPRGATRVWPR